MVLVLLLLSFQPDPSILRKLFEDHAAQAEAKYGQNDARTAAAWRDLGLFLRDIPDLPGSRGALKKVLEIDERLFRRSDGALQRDAADLARVSPPAEAVPLWERVSEGPDASVSAEAYGRLGDLHVGAGDRAGAAALFRNALEREESAAAGKNAPKVAVRLNSLALVLEPRAALPLLQRALAIDRNIWGEKHPETATTKVNLSGVLLALGRAPEAVQMGRTALATFEKTMGGDHPRTAAAASTLADALRATRQPAEAGKLYRRALLIDEQAYGPRHPETLNDIRNLAEFLRETGQREEAARLEQRLCANGGPCR